MNNKMIKELMRMKKIPYWKVAEMMNCSEMTIYRWLRKPLTDEHYQKIMDAINQLSGGGTNE